MQELETKFLLMRGKKPRKALRRLLQDLAWAGFQIHPKTTRLVHDVYFDTPDERLRRAGWSLRCRHRSLALQLTCKQLTQSDDGFFERREIEQSTLHETPSPDTLEEGPVLDLLKRYVPKSAELEARFSQDNRRSTYLLSNPAFPRASAELVMDRVVADGPEPLCYVEFECELKQGPASLLTSVSEVLAAHPGLIPSRTSKFHRGHFNLHGAIGVGDRKRELMTPEDAWSKLAEHYLAEQMQALTAYEPFAYEGLHPEGVHQMRVATRRLRAALKAFGDVLPEQEARALAGEAGWLCDVLGAVRDLDVHLEHLDGYRSWLPEDQSHALDGYERHLTRARRRARRCLIAALDSRRYRRLQDAYLSLQQHAREMHHEGGPSIRAFARGYVPGKVAAVRKAGRKIDAASAPEAYHRLRIRIKKLRYGLEILDGPYGRELEKAARSLRRLQGRLGEHQDACVAEGELTGYRDAAATGAEERRVFDRLIREERRRALSLRRRHRADWKQFEATSRKLKKLF